jgi:hypothetical protein
MSQFLAKGISSLDGGLRDRAARALFPLLMEIQLRCPEQIWLGGGTLRDILIGSSMTADSDIDLLFFNPKETSKNYEAEIEAELLELTNIQNLSVKNQARMGFVADGARYENLLQSVAAFPDVTVAVAACVQDMSRRTALIFAPYGLPSRDTPFIQPTSRYLAVHGLSAYYSWLDRKKYNRRFYDWTIDIVGRTPIERARVFERAYCPRPDYTQFL